MLLPSTVVADQWLLLPFLTSSKLTRSGTRRLQYTIRVWCGSASPHGLLAAIQHGDGAYRASQSIDRYWSTLQSLVMSESPMETANVHYIIVHAVLFGTLDYRRTLRRLYWPYVYASCSVLAGSIGRTVAVQAGLRLVLTIEWMRGRRPMGNSGTCGSEQLAK